MSVRCDRPVQRCVLESGHEGHCAIEADDDCYLFWDAGELLEPNERQTVEEYRKKSRRTTSMYEYPEWEHASIRELLAIIDRLAPKPEGK